MNAIYLVAADVPATAAPRCEWHAVKIPGDAQGRWLLLARHGDEAEAAAFDAQPGVTLLPHPMSSTPLGTAAISLLAGFGIVDGDTVFTALQKIRSYWPKAAAEWR